MSTPKTLHLLIIAGDPSADQHAGALIDALRSKRNDLRISALGGPFLAAKADAFLYPLVSLGGFGFWEPLLKLPQLLWARRKVERLFQTDTPDLVVPMDYYGFNIHIARLAKSRGIPVAYYISPQVWASRPHRIQKLAAAVNKMFVIFPFEVELYQKAGVPVEFVGHPLLESLPLPVAPEAPPTLGLLPGSRPGTVKRHLPMLLEAASLTRRMFPNARYLLFRPESIPADFYQRYLRDRSWIELTTDPGYHERKRLWVALSVSGTAALENMLLGIPMIIFYKLSTLTYWIAKHLIRVPYVGIPNLLAKEAVVPELLQDAATPSHLAEQAMALLRNDSERQSMREKLLSLRSLLQDGGSTRAAGAILGMLA